MQLFPVQRAVVVPACAHGPGQHDARGIQALPDAVEVADAGDLLDEHRREALAAELLVHAEEVDLGRRKGLVAHANLHGDGGDEGHQLAGLRCSHTNVVFALPAWRHHGPESLVRQIRRNLSTFYRFSFLWGGHLGKTYHLSTSGI